LELTASTGDLNAGTEYLVSQQLCLLTSPWIHLSPRRQGFPFLNDISSFLLFFFFKELQVIPSPLPEGDYCPLNQQIDSFNFVPVQV